MRCKHNCFTTRSRSLAVDTHGDAMRTPGMLCVDQVLAIPVDSKAVRRIQAAPDRFCHIGVRPIRRRVRVGTLSRELYSHIERDDTFALPSCEDMSLKHPLHILKQLGRHYSPDAVRASSSSGTGASTMCGAMQSSNCSERLALDFPHSRQTTTCKAEATMPSALRRRRKACQLRPGSWRPMWPGEDPAGGATQPVCTPLCD